MSTKRTEFFDGFTSETTPDTVIVSADGLIGEWTGPWVSQDYTVDQAVEFNGSSYICILDTTAMQDPTNTLYWDLVALKGTDGTSAGIFVRETPTGAIDGVNTVFTLSVAPTQATNLAVYIDGIFLDDADYSLGGTTLTLTTAPALGQTIFVQYSHSGSILGGGTEQIIYHTISGPEEAAKQFTLSVAPANALLTLVDIIGGVPQQYSVDFTITGTTFNWSGLGLDGQLLAGDVVRLKYFS